ncbi:MAG: hypothetical protein ACPKM0_04070 [Pleomorphochaeta sp.]
MKKSKLILTVSLIAVLLSSCATQEVMIESDVISDSLYLSTTLDVNIEDSISEDQLIDEIATISEMDLSTVSDVFVALVKAGEFEELALTYTEEKAQARLDYYGISDVKTSDAKYVACALDAHMIDIDCAKSVLADSISSDVANTLVMNVAQVLGVARHYVGKVSDSDIMNKIATTFDSYYIFSDNNLDIVGKELVKAKASTGYNLKKEGENANFISDLTIKYGHCEEKHLKQLVALLNSEGIDAKLQIEPKVSVYQYMLEWGPIPEPSYSYFVEQYSDDFYLVNALEYDALFEFENEADLLDFDRIINQYSKKNSENQAEGSDVKLISGAWWQPLYSTEDMHDEDAYQAIYDCVALDGGYSIHPFTLVETKDQLASDMRILTDATIDLREFYVNNAFYRYLTGESWE